MNRRTALASIAAAVALPTSAGAKTVRMVVTKSPTCGCCTAWVRHIRDAGFLVEAHDVGQDALYALKAQLGVRPEYSSCHTGEIDGYVIEGHVPAEEVSRLLETRPDALGLAVPGMPVGSPGMEMGARKDPYDVLLIRRDGSSAVFARK